MRGDGPLWSATRRCVNAARALSLSFACETKGQGSAAKLEAESWKEKAGRASRWYSSQSILFYISCRRVVQNIHQCEADGDLRQSKTANANHITRAEKKRCFSSAKACKAHTPPTN